LRRFFGHPASRPPLSGSSRTNPGVCVCVCVCVGRHTTPLHFCFVWFCVAPHSHLTIAPVAKTAVAQASPQDPDDAASLSGDCGAMDDCLSQAEVRSEASLPEEVDCLLGSELDPDFDRSPPDSEAGAPGGPDAGPAQPGGATPAPDGVSLTFRPPGHRGRGVVRTAAPNPTPLPGPPPRSLQVPAPAHNTHTQLTPGAEPTHSAPPPHPPPPRRPL
jgi:hypothetical protein